GGAREPLGRAPLAQPRATGPAPRCRCGWPLAARRPGRGGRQRQLHALVIAAPPALRERLGPVGSTPQLVPPVQRPAPTPNGDGPRARPIASSNAAWSATSPASSTDSSRT